MALTLALRLDGDASGLTGEVRISREELARLEGQLDNTGAQARQTATALDRSGDAARRSATGQAEAAQAARQAATSGQEAAREAGNLAREQVNAAAAASRFTAGIRETARSTPTATRALREHARAVNDNSRQIARSTAQYRQFGHGVQQAGYQVGDFFVQVASGQSPMRAFIQQFTQLISFFGPWGAVIGAAAAILGALYIAMDDTAQKADALSAEISDLAAEARTAALGFDELKKKIDALGGAGRGLLAVEAALQLIDIREKLPELNTGLDATRAAFERVLGMGERIDAFADHVGASAEDLRELAEAGTQISGSSTADELNAMADAVARFVADNPGAIAKMGDSFRGLLASLREAAEAKTALELLQAVLGETAKAATAAQDPVAKFIDVIEASVEVYRLEGVTRDRRVAADKAEAEARKSIKELTDDQVASIRAAAEAAASEKAAIDAAREAREEDARALKQDFDARVRAAEQRYDTIEGLRQEKAQQEALRDALNLNESAVEAVGDQYKALAIIRRLDLDETSAQAQTIRDLVTTTNELARANQRVIDAQRKAESEARKAAEESARIAKQTVDDVVEYGAEGLNDWLANTGEGWRGLWEDMKSFALRTISRLTAEAVLRPIVVPIVSSFLGGSSGSGAANDNRGGLGRFNPISAIGNRIVGNIADRFLPTISTPTSLVQTAAPITNALGITAPVTPTLVPGTGAIGGTAITGYGGTAFGGTLAPGSGVAAGPMAGIAGPVALAALAAFAAYQFGLIGPGPTSGPNSIADISPGLGRDLAFGPNEVNLAEAYTADNGGDPLAIQPLAERVVGTIHDILDRFFGDIEQSLRFRIAHYFAPEGGNADDRVEGVEVNAFIRGEAERRIAEGLTEEQAVFEATKFTVQNAITFASDTLNEVARNTTAESLDALIADLELGRQLDALREAVIQNDGRLDANTLATAAQTAALEESGRNAAEAATQSILEFFERARGLFPAIAASNTNATGAAGAVTATAGDLALLSPGLPALEQDRGTILAQPGYSFQAANDDLRPAAIGTIGTPAGSFTLDQIGSDDTPGARNFAVYDEAGELVETFHTVSDALARANEIARSYVEAQSEVNGLTEEEQARHDANRERINLVIRSTEQQLQDVFDGITGAAEDHTFGAYQARLVSGTAQIEAMSDALDQFNDDLRASYEEFPRLTEELGPLSDRLIDVTETIADQVAALAEDVVRTFNEDLDREFNALTGASAIDTVRDLVELREQRRGEAFAIGADDAPVLRNFEAAVGNAFDGLDIDVLRAVRENIVDPAVRALADEAIADQVASSAASLRDQLDREANGFAGNAAIDDVRDLITLRDERLRTAIANDVDASLVQRNFELAVEAAFEGLDQNVVAAIRANITDPVVRELADTAIAEAAAAAAAEQRTAVASFNRDIADNILARTAPGLRDLIQLNRRFEDALAYANDNGGDAGAVRELFRHEAEALANGGRTLADTLANTVQEFDRLVPSLQGFKHALAIDAELSTGTTLERYAAANENFERIASKALTGDATAAGQIEATGRSFLELSRQVNAANDNYTADFDRVNAVIDDTLSFAQNEIDLARDQLDTLNGIDDTLSDILSTLSGTADDRLGASPTRNAILAQASGFTGSFGGGGFLDAANTYASSTGIGLGNNAALNAQLAFVTGFNGDFGGGRWQEWVTARSEVEKEAARILLTLAGEPVGFYAGGDTRRAMAGGGLVMNGARSADSVVSLARDEFVIRGQSVARIGVPVLSYINERGELPQVDGRSDAGVIAAVDRLVAAIRDEGMADRLQSRDDADHVAARVDELAATIGAGGDMAAHERARPGRAS